MLGRPAAGHPGVTKTLTQPSSWTVVLPGLYPFICFSWLCYKMTPISSFWDWKQYYCVNPIDQVQILYRCCMNGVDYPHNAIFDFVITMFFGDNEWRVSGLVWQNSKAVIFSDTVNSEAVNFSELSVGLPPFITNFDDLDLTSASRGLLESGKTVRCITQ